MNEDDVEIIAWEVAYESEFGDGAGVTYEAAGDLPEHPREAWGDKLIEARPLVYADEGEEPLLNTAPATDLVGDLLTMGDEIDSARMSMLEVRERIVSLLSEHGVDEDGMIEP